MSSSLKRPSPPTPTILGRRRGGGRGGGERGCEWEAEKGRKEGREGMGRGEGHNPYVEHLHRVKLHISLQTYYCHTLLDNTSQCTVIAVVFAGVRTST